MQYNFTDSISFYQAVYKKHLKFGGNSQPRRFAARVDPRTSILAVLARSY